MSTTGYRNEMKGNKRDPNVCWPCWRSETCSPGLGCMVEELTEQSDLQPRPQLRSQVLNNGTAVDERCLHFRNRAVHFTCLSHTCVQGVRESAGARLRQQIRVGKQEEWLASSQTHTHTHVKTDERTRTSKGNYEIDLPIIWWQHGSGSLVLSQRSFGIWYTDTSSSRKKYTGLKFTLTRHF